MNRAFDILDVHVTVEKHNEAPRVSITWKHSLFLRCLRLSRRRVFCFSSSSSFSRARMCSSKQIKASSLSMSNTHTQRDEDKSFLTHIIWVKSMINRASQCVCACSYFVVPHLQQKWGCPAGTVEPQTRWFCM